METKIDAKKSKKKEKSAAIFLIRFELNELEITFVFGTTRRQKYIYIYEIEKMFDQRRIF